MNWFGLIVIVGGSAGAWCSWRWGIPYNESVYQMVSTRPIEPGSYRYRMIRFSRWVGVVASCFFVVAGVAVLFSGH